MTSRIEASVLSNRSPVWPTSINSGIPPVRLPSTGTPRANASTTMRPKGSFQTDGTMRKSIVSRKSSDETQPVNSTPSGATAFRDATYSARPVPAIDSTEPSGRCKAQVSSSRSTPVLGVSMPRKPKRRLCPADRAALISMTGSGRITVCPAAACDANRPASWWACRMKRVMPTIPLSRRVASRRPTVASRHSRHGPAQFCPRRNIAPCQHSRK